MMTRAQPPERLEWMLRALAEALTESRSLLSQSEEALTRPDALPATLNATPAFHRALQDLDRLGQRIDDIAEIIRAMGEATHPDILSPLTRSEALDLARLEEIRAHLTPEDAADPPAPNSDLF